MSDRPKPVEQLIDQLRGDGPEEPGHFTLSRERAREMAQQHLLERPREYILLLVRAALRRDAPDIQITIFPNRMVLRFGGEPFRKGELDRLEDAVVAPPGGAVSPGLRELALAVLAARSLELPRIRISSGAGSEGVSLTFEPKWDRRLVSTRRRNAVTIIELRGDGKPHPGFREERLLVEARCRYTPRPLWLNGCPLSDPAAFAELTVARVELEEEGLRASAGVLPLKDTPAQVRFVLDGVWVATELLDTKEPGFVVYVQVDGLRMDLALARVIHDDAHARAHLAARHLLDKAREQHQVPAEREAHRHRYLAVQKRLDELVGRFAGWRLGHGLGVVLSGVAALTSTVLWLSLPTIVVFFGAWGAMFLAAATLSRLWRRNEARLLRELGEAFPTKTGDAALAHLAYQSRQEQGGYPTIRPIFNQFMKGNALQRRGPE